MHSLDYNEGIKQKQGLKQTNENTRDQDKQLDAKSHRHRAQATKQEVGRDEPALKPVEDDTQGQGLPGARKEEHASLAESLLLLVEK